ncbi:MAG TPA: YitT family protein [Cerasibacillus sp.]|uniref:YitT family protein n=1 Tax=Cerasibacillus sp. TaxID=2498711 RepID=UPI002F3E9E23
MVLKEVKRTFIVIIGALLNAIALNFFLIGANVYASGFSGAAQLVSSIFNDFLNMNVGTGILLFLFNIPVIILGWLKVGRAFTVYSLVSVAFTTLFLEVLPVLQVSEDIILNAVFGGLIGGASVGITLRIGGSTGGMDIIALVLSRIKDRPIGIYFLALNALIIGAAGILYEPENALYTLLSLYINTRVIDAIHTRYQKLTAMIITKEKDELQQAIHDKLIRGITILPAKGAYSNEEKHMLYLVITRYELYDLETIIRQVDPRAFTNIVQTTSVLGFFRRDE